MQVSLLSQGVFGIIQWKTNQLQIARADSYLSSGTPGSRFLGNFWADGVKDELSWISSYETLDSGELTQVIGLMLSRYLKNSAEFYSVLKSNETDSDACFETSVLSNDTSVLQLGQDSLVTMIVSGDHIDYYPF